MTTGELARRAEVTLRTVRFYEEKGFISRTGQGFTEEAFITLEKIKLLQEAGFRLEEIDRILRELEKNPTTAKNRQQACENLLSEAKENIQKKIDQLTKVASHIEGVLEYGESCGNCGAADCGECYRLTEWENFGFTQNSDTE